MEFTKSIGPEGKLQLAIHEGKVAIIIKHEGASGTEDITIKEDLGYFIDKLVAALPDGTLKNFLAPVATIAKSALQSV